MYPIYDVYNNAFRNGGKLNITLDRYFIMRETESSRLGFLSESILQRKTKYENRSNMSDVTMRVATVVSIELIPKAIPRKNYFNTVNLF